ncbi:hypothetical protein JL720_13905 [Aureococcus anophagefferens]|nr:hypothetical protein JL720_13905 [Aureococcus anophagefferens]
MMGSAVASLAEIAMPLFAAAASSSMASSEMLLLLLRSEIVAAARRSGPVFGPFKGQ